MELNKTQKYTIGYAGVSVMLLSWSIFNSLENSTNSLVFLTELTTGYNLGILINFIFLLFLVVGKLLQVILFGELRIIEAEHIIERAPVFFITLLFNLTSNDNNVLLNCVLLGITVGFKIFHIILVDRMDFVHMKIYNLVTNGSFTRSQVLHKYVISLYFWLIFSFFVADFAIAKFLVYDVFQGINSVTCLLFGFQFAVQGVDALCYFGKLLLNIFELAFYRSFDPHDHVTDTLGEDVTTETRANGTGDLDDEEEDESDRVWENKALFTKAIDISSALLKAVSHLAFIYLLTIHSGLALPISMLQGTYVSLKQTYKEITQLLAFIESSKKLDSQLPNATKQELDAADNLCIICREDMHPSEEYETSHHKKLPFRRQPKKLRCGHILHMGCLKDWLERSEICPLCRRSVFQNGQGQQQPTAHAQAQPAAEPAAQPPAPAPAAAPAVAAVPAPQDHRARQTPDPIPTRTRTEDAPEIQRESNGHTTENQAIRPTNLVNVSQIRAVDASRVHETSSTSRGNGQIQEFEPSTTFNGVNIHASTSNGTPIVNSQNGVESSSEAYLRIRLPSNALIPPDWTLLPLTKLSKDSYTLHLSNSHTGTLKIMPNFLTPSVSIFEPVGPSSKHPGSLNEL